MKKTINTGVLSLAAILVVMAACTRNISDSTPRESDPGKLSNLQVYNAAINTNRNVIYMDGVPLHSIAMVYTSAAFSGSGVTYGVSPGLHTFLVRDTAAVTTQPPISFPNSLEAGKYYTTFLYDTLTAVKQITVETKRDIPLDTTARIRFAYLTYNKAGTPGNIDIYSKVRKENIFTNVPYKTVTNFIPYASRKSDTLIVRATGTTTDLTSTAMSFSEKRSYTVIFRGRNGEIAGNSFPATLTNFINF